MKKWLSNYFSLSKREFNGLMALIILVLLMEAVPYTFKFFIAADHKNDLAELSIVRLLLTDNVETLKGIVKGSKVTSDRVRHSLFRFDPNTITKDGWQKLGLSEKQALSVLKYIAKGGRFKKGEDLKKMYTISAELYGVLLPYVEIANTGTEKNAGAGKNGDSHQMKDHATNTTNNKSLWRVTELNTADSTALDEIKGIGPAFASRIIKYRKRLGGFYKKEQLMEVFGMDSLKFNEIKGQIVINVDQLNKININTAVFEDFKNHPYIRYKQVNALIQYRKQHGNYGNIADLNRVAILDEETILRIAPYLTF